MQHVHSLKLVECPRDAMQGWKYFIPTAEKIRYINALLKVGFDTIDFGSFVSPKAIPQLADTAEVVEGLNIDSTATKLLAIVANTRGAEAAVQQEKISSLGFPFSISPVFQLRNTNSTMEESLKTVATIRELCTQHRKELVVYLSMGFGNPYNDAYSADMVLEWLDQVVRLGVSTISIADTVGLASAVQVSDLVKQVIPAYPEVEIGVHLHSTSMNWEEKTAAALDAGCRRFDGAFGGIGGCPMAGDELVGNMDTSMMIPYFRQQGLLNGINMEALAVAQHMAVQIFGAEKLPLN